MAKGNLEEKLIRFAGAGSTLAEAKKNLAKQLPYPEGAKEYKIFGTSDGKIDGDYVTIANFMLRPGVSDKTGKAGVSYLRTAMEAAAEDREQKY